MLRLAMNKCRIRHRTDQFRPRSRLRCRADRAAPACFAGLVELNAPMKPLYLSSVTAAPPFTYQSTFAPGIADLTGEEAERANLALVGRAGREKAGVRALSGRPSRPALQRRTPSRRSASDSRSDPGHGGRWRRGSLPRTAAPPALLNSQHLRLEGAAAIAPMRSRSSP